MSASPAVLLTGKDDLSSFWVKPLCQGNQHQRCTSSYLRSVCTLPCENAAFLEIGILLCEMTDN